MKFQRGMAGLLFWLTIAATAPDRGVGETWEESQWGNTLYYRCSLTAKEAAVGSLYVAAADEYQVYFNGALAGADSVWSRMAGREIDIAEGENHIAVRVVNRGRGTGNGVMVRTATEDGVLAETTIDQSRQLWVWTAVEQKGLGWTMERMEELEGWERVQSGSIDVEQIAGLRDSSIEVVAGFPWGLDMGSLAGGIALKEVRGQNLALDKPASQRHVADGDMDSSWDLPIDAQGKTAWIDLGRRRLVSEVWVLTRGKTEEELSDNSLLGYNLELSEERKRWVEVGRLRNIRTPRKSEVTFPPLLARYVRLEVADEDEVTLSRVAEIEVYGEGYVERGTYVSPVFDLGLPGARKNFGQVEWEAETGRGTEVSVQFRTGDKGDDFADSESGWSAPVIGGAGDFPGEEPGVLLQYRINMATQADSTTPVFRRLAVDFDEGDIAVSRALGSVHPNRVPIGKDTPFTYSLELTFGPDDLGVARIVIDVPGRAELEQILGLSETMAWEWSSSQSELEITFDRPLREDAELELVFASRTSSAHHRFRARLFSPGSEAPINARESREIDIETGEISSWLLLATTTKVKVLAEVRAVPVLFTPNGDGINDAAHIEFTLSKVSSPRLVRVWIFDLAGGRVHHRELGWLEAGAYQRGAGDRGAPELWDGRDAGGGLVPPGLYVYRIEVDLDTGEEVVSGVVGVAY